METTPFQEPLMLPQQLIHACIQGDSSAVLLLLLSAAREESSIDIDQADGEGTPPLCYASCWGHAHIVALLLAAGADVDRSDKNGWTPLMWAAANSHNVITQLLLDHGADPTRTNQKGQKLEEIVRSSSSLSSYTDSVTEEAANALDLDAEISAAARSAFVKEKNTFLKSDDEDEGDDDHLTVSSHDWMSQTSGTLFSLGRREREREREKAAATETIKELEYDDDDQDNVARTPFVWDSPQLDQILIFEEKNISRILHVAITELRPTKLSMGKPIPANIIFLGARYAHYLSSLELLNEFLGESVKAICKEVRKDPSLRLSTFKYHRIFAELVQELYDLAVAFVRGETLSIIDSGILDYADTDAIPVVSTSVLQEAVAPVTATGRFKRASWILYKQTNDLFSSAVRAAAKVGSMAIPSSQLHQQQKRLRTVIPSASLNPSLSKRWAHIYGPPSIPVPSPQPRSTPTPANAIPTPPASPTPIPPLRPHTLQPQPKKTRHTSKPPTPKTISQILTTTLTSFHLSHVHPTITQQLFHQILTTLNQSLFEGLLNPIRYNRSFTDAWSTRSRAVAIRINLSSTETWIRDNEAHIRPPHVSTEEYLNNHPLTPTFQLMQYLHVLTSLDSLEAYLDIMPSLPFISLSTQKRVLGLYRREEKEEGVCEDVKMYVEEMEEAQRVMREQEDREKPLLVLFDVSDCSGAESGVEEENVGEKRQRRSSLSIPWENTVFPFKVPLFEEDDCHQGEVGEWKHVGRPHVPPLVLRMLDGGDAAMHALDEEDEEEE
ncbi:UNVERIFIED_CONTAM: hypothetical protein HDU68_009148 [Siphonaria sp. JEL0065]|nr:hypothetical protein HDU68_009148 [Siphonaria sp. JEL0065]